MKNKLNIKLLTNFSKWVSNYINEKVIKRIDQKILIYSVFVIIATIFWFLNKLSGTFNATLDFPVKYINLPKDKVLANELPQKLNLAVNAYGYTLLRYKLSPAPFPVEINLDKYATQINNPNISKFSLNTRYAREEITKQINTEIEVIDILPDTITFYFANLVDKIVPVLPNVNLEFAPQCMLESKITFKPSRVLVRGPNNILDTLKGVYTKEQTYENLSKPVVDNISLAEIKSLKIEKNSVAINIPVSKFTEATLEVPVEAINVPDSLVIKTFPRFTKVTFLVSLNNYNNIEASDFVISVDYLKIRDMIGGKLPLDVTLLPKNVNGIKLNPSYVEYLRERK